MSGRASTPHKVVRFYGNTDFALEAVAGRQVTLVHVSKLNDPFDPYFFFETDFENDYDRLLSYVRNRSSKDSDWFQSHVPRERWQQSIDSVEAHVKSYRDSTFVLSCSAVSKDSHPKDNLYLWGHYGAGHRGVAIEFETKKTISLLVNDNLGSKNLDLEDPWIKINYDTQAPRLTAKIFYQFYRSEYEGRQERTPLHNYVDSTTHFKSSVWSREQEWRILWRNDETRLKIHKVKIPEDVISAVYVGLAASPSVQDDVVFETRRNFPTAKIFKARKRNGYAELRFEQI
jgi:hypothetical protein